MSTTFCLKYLVLKLNQIRKLHIELSSRCQASCPLCLRNLYGYYDRPDFSKTDLTFEKIKQIFDNVDLDIEFIYYNGNFGDPCINTDIIRISEYFFSKFPNLSQIGVSTNGGMHKPDWWYDLGKKFTPGKFIVDFCIDGLEDTNHLYRIGVPFKKAIENAQAFISSGALANWRYVVFKHNQHQVEAARQLSKDLGFHLFINNDQGRDDGYVKTSENQGYWIEPADYKNMKSMIPLPEEKNGDLDAYNKFMDENEKKYSKVKEISWKRDKRLNCNQHLDQSMVYINSVGELYPCCFLGLNPKTYAFGEHNSQLKEILANFNNNLTEVNWEKAIEWFNVIEEGWKKDTIKDGMIAGCLLCCHHRKEKVDMIKN